MKENINLPDNIDEAVDDTVGKTNDVITNITNDVTANIANGVTANTTNDVTANIANDVTANTTNDVAANIANGVTANITNGVTANITNGVTANITNDVTANITNGVTANITNDVTANIIGNETKENTIKSEEVSSGDNNSKVTFTLKDVFDYGKIIVLALVLAFLLNHYIVANAKIPTGSMENTVMPNDRVLAFRLSYLFEDPKRGDIVIFHFPDDESQEFLKRVVGLPGDIVDIVDGKVFINDSDIPLEENYIKDIPNGDFGPYEVPADSYFVMGDNRDDSYDSRFWDNTFVARDKIVAKAIIRYFPSIKLLK
jgi:signal peptidase I